jgi:hypothetical protein
MQTLEISLSSPERRRQRSAERATALTYQLDQVVEDFDLEACLIADGQGSLLACCTGVDAELARTLAAVAPGLARERPTRTLVLPSLRRHLPELNETQFSACEFRAQGKRLFVVAVGRDALMKEVGIVRALLGVRRIHGNTDA